MPKVILSGARDLLARGARSFAAISMTVLCMMVFASGCAARNVSTAGMVLPERAAVVFFVDGMHLPRMRELSNAGELPNIRRHFEQGGVTVAEARDALPAVTYANTVTLLTGCLPSTHGIVGNRWFEPAAGRWHDYGSVFTYREVNADFTTPTIYERLRVALPESWSVSSVCHTNRGVDVELNDAVSSGLAWLVGDYQAVDRRSGENVWDVAARARSVGRWPALQLYYFPGVDEIGHHHGSDSTQYAAALRNADAAVGGVFDAHEQFGLMDRTYFVLVSDHGHVPMARHVDLAAWLREERGLRVSDPRRRSVANVDVVCVPNAGRVIALHLRGGASWEGAAEVVLRERVLRGDGDIEDEGAAGGCLWDSPAVGAVCWLAGEDRVCVRSGAGALDLVRRGDSGGVIETQGARGDEALERRCVVLADEMFRLLSHPHGGDVLVFASEGWGFTPYAGGHGGLLEAEMRIPLFFRGPDLAAGGRIEGGHIADVTPTVLELLGVEVAGEELDGLSLAGRLRGVE